MKIRQDESKEFKKSSQEYKDAAEAVEQAIGVLREYYAGAASLLQRGAPGAASAPGRAEGAGTGLLQKPQAGAASTVLSILDMCGKDFMKLHVELQQSEREAELAFEKMSAESRATKAAKEAEVRGKESEIRSLDVAIG